MNDDWVNSINAFRMSFRHLTRCVCRETLWGFETRSNPLKKHLKSNYFLIDSTRSLRCFCERDKKILEEKARLLFLLSRFLFNNEWQTISPEPRLPDYLAANRLLSIKLMKLMKSFFIEPFCRARPWKKKTERIIQRIEIKRSFWMLNLKHESSGEWIASEFFLTTDEND